MSDIETIRRELQQNLEGRTADSAGWIALNRLEAELKGYREVSERVKGLVPTWRERGRHKPEFAGGYYFILADELEAALADQQNKENE